MKKLIKICQKAYDSFLEPALIVSGPFIGMAVGGKTEYLQVAQATTKKFYEFFRRKKFIVNRHAWEWVKIECYVIHFKESFKIK